jgi:hypothetical protein
LALECPATRGNFQLAAVGQKVRDAGTAKGVTAYRGFPKP